ncbi:MAG: VOC family protein, partial [Acidimicrobiia bacterium]
MRSVLDPEDLLLAAGVAVECLAGAVEPDWEAPAGHLPWTCRATVDHVVDTLLWYSVQLATESRGPLPAPRRGDPDGKPRFLLASLRSSAAVLAAVVRAADPSVRAFHAAGMADPEGFTAMGCDEI